MVQDLVVYADPRIGQQPAVESSGPPLGKWQFTGKDDKGVVWTGTLEIQKLDTDRFDADKYHSICSLELKSADSSRGVEAPCKWEPGKREVSFSTGGTTYTAILSPDGKSLANGKWSESKKDFQSSKVIIIKTGVWSAKFTAP
ncbi:MAG: hypothetical protein V1874_11000 [Spirochaetota bacterium]